MLSYSPHLGPAPCLWRRGELLIATKDAAFPPRCLKTNQPTDQYRAHYLYWNHPALLLVFLLICLCGPVGLGLAVITLALHTRKSTLNLPFAPAVLSQRRKRILNIMTACAAICSLFPLAGLLKHPWPALAAIVGFLCVSIHASIYVPLVTVQEIRGDYVSILGACPEFLEGLPEFRGALR